MQHHIIRNIIKRGHESTLEHVSFGVRFICDRGVTHELVRHRHCSFSQESTRYVNYKNDDMEFIAPCWIDYTDWDDCGYLWQKEMKSAEVAYKSLIRGGWSPQQARSVLPNSVKTEIVMTTNLRDWRHIFHLRCDQSAHPQMRELMIPLYNYLNRVCPTIFDSVKFN